MPACRSDFPLLRFGSQGLLLSRGPASVVVMLEGLLPFSFPRALCRTILPRYLIRDEVSPAFWAYHCSPPILHQVINGVLELTAKLETHVARVTINYRPPGWEAPIGFQILLLIDMGIPCFLRLRLAQSFSASSSSISAAVLGRFPNRNKPLTSPSTESTSSLGGSASNPSRTAKTLAMWVFLTPHKSQQNAKVDQGWPHITQFTSEIMCHVCPILL